MNSFMHVYSILLEKIYLNIADVITTESPSVNYAILCKYSGKVIPKAARYIDLDEFHIKNPYKERENLIGYIGRLDESKGIDSLVRAMEVVIQRDHNVKFLIGGGGLLYNDINDFVTRKALSDNIRLVGWIRHSEIPLYLNKLKLLILPSDSEGLPTIVLEAMACGTPVLATSVGGIPDIVIDEVTGFILSSSSPAVIVENIDRVKNFPHIDLIILNARKKIETEYSYQSAVHRFEEIMDAV
jgi:Glycosyltransferase